MANTTLTTDLRAMHAAIVAGISAQFPTLATVEFYREDRKDLPLPACILELEEMPSAPDENPGNGQQPIEARFCAHFVLGFRTENVRLEIRLLAAAMAAFLYEKRWDGITCDPAQFHGAYEDDFKPEFDQFECWKVDWSHIIFLGTDVWNEDGAITPTVVKYSWAPDIGLENEGKYIEL
jgi:hypothetical protein